jgi:hypothetical protein
MADPFGFLQSRAARGYSPQFLDTGTQAETPMAGAQSPDLTNRLLQVLSGQLGGTLSGGEKLSALGALLKSVSRGSQTSPQQVMQSIQQQKLQEVQGRIQLDQLRKQAEQQAQLGALKAEYIANAPDPQTARELQLMTAEDFSAFLRERRKPEGMGQWSEALGRFIPKNTPVPTRSGRVNGKRVDQYSDGSTRVYEADGSFKTYDVQGNLVNG